jgi:hypothetical protein
MITIHWHPSPAELRRWALRTALALGVMGALFQFVDWGVFRTMHPMGRVLWGFGAFALVTAGTGTRIGLPAYWAWMGFVWTVGTVIGTVALAIVFFLDEEKLRNKAIFFIRTVDKVDLDKVRRRPPPAYCRLRCRRSTRRRCSPVNALAPPRPAPPVPSFPAGQRRAAALRRGGEGAAGAARGVAAGRVRQARGGAPRLGQGAERAAR